jgi:class 3 adenylate cyclase/CHASE2 domain-containing sensor protein
VQLKTRNHAPLIISVAVILCACFLRVLNWEFLEPFERTTYDMRVREALRFHPAAATNLGFVLIDEASLKALQHGSVNGQRLGYNSGLLWPRQVYGRLVEELADQGARAVGLDIIFGELRPDHPPVRMSDGGLVESDDFFATQMRRASNVIISMSEDVTTPPAFLTNALAPGDITTEKDGDGILRRVQAFRYYTNWHQVFLQAREEYDIDLLHPRFEPGRLILSGPEGEIPPIPLDKDGNFDLTSLIGDTLPQGMARWAKPFTVDRVWHMGIVLAAQELKLDLARAEVDLPRGRITLRGPGVERVLPVDKDGFFYIDWCLPPEDPRIAKEAIQTLLLQNRMRILGKTDTLTNRWKGKLVVVGSAAVVGNNLTDRGATPLLNDTLLVSKHWNVANSIILGRFVRRSSLPADLALIIIPGALAAWFTLRFRALTAFCLVLLTAAFYVVAADVAYVKWRFWVPLILPMFFPLLINHVCLLIWRVVFEQAEQRRVKSIFSKVVSPKIVKKLLAEGINLAGARREVTVLFADVRGFTELTDTSQQRVEEFVLRKGLQGEASELARNDQARETLETVNLYLGLVADIIISKDGTLDKFIGDCVMAFWGAPDVNPNHSSACVRAAIEAQRAIHALNLERAAMNKNLELENRARVSAGLEPKPLLPLLMLGSGINTGMATVGLMGSRGVLENYTVFGGDVNLASRLEGLSGRGRIFITQSTYEHLLREVPSLAATCIARPPEKVKGISRPVVHYEVPWAVADPSTHDPQPPAQVSASTGAASMLKSADAHGDLPGQF